MSDEMKLKRALASNSSAEPNRTFEYLYNKYVNLLIFISSSILDNEADIEDAVQESFMKLFNNAYSIRSNIKSYLSTICKNTSLDILRKNSRLVQIDDQAIDYLEYKDDYHSARLDILISDMREVLSDGDVNIIISHIIDNKRFSDIALELGIKPQAVKNRYYRGLKKYRSEGGAINEEN